MQQRSSSVQSDIIIQANLWLTLVFAVTATYAAASFTTTAQWVGAVTAMILFAIGVFVFLWGYWNAVQRSRTDELAVSQLYLLLGDAIPKTVRRVMLSTLALQFVIALVTTIARPNGPNGGSGSSLAVGFLVPMLGFGFNGLWAVYHGTFAVRADVPNSTDQVRQNVEHG